MADDAVAKRVVIRAQYHFRRVGEDVHIWDVRKLVERAQALPMLDWPLSDLAEIEEPYWTEGNPNLSTRDILVHANLIGAADLSYPILLCAEGRVMDGMHRVAKALRFGRRTIRARQLSPTPPPDFTNVDPEDLAY